MRLAFYIGSFGTFWDRRICYITRGPHSHVEMVFSNGSVIGSSPRYGGVRVCTSPLNPSHWSYLLCHVSQEEEGRIYEWATTEIGAGYD
jgi:hypothetical protein